MKRMILVLLVSLVAPGAVAEIETWAAHDGKSFTHISGSIDDFARIGELKQEVGGAFIYARQGRVAWLIRDEQTVQTIRAICKEPTRLLLRRRAIEDAMREIDRAAERIDRRIESLEELREGRDDKPEWADEERLLREAARRVEDREADLDKAEREMDRDYEIWEQDLERAVRRVVEHSIAVGTAMHLRK